MFFTVLVSINVSATGSPLFCTLPDSQSVLMVNLLASSLVLGGEIRRPPLSVTFLYSGRCDQQRITIFGSEW